MINLWESHIPGYDRSLSDEVPHLVPYLVEDGKIHSAVIVCPGGGYQNKAPHEGEPIARWLNSIGISAFVLNYRVAPYKDPIPLLDAQRAIRLVRYNSEEWCIDKNKIGILGFSAGGHLTSTAGTHFDYGNNQAKDPIDKVSCRPDAVILCYAVITFGEYRHHGSMVNLLGENPDEKRRFSLSNENSVALDTPQTFLWHTAEDQAVPVENSILFASSLSKNRIPFELHVFPKGHHGIGLAKDFPQASQWTVLCDKWLTGIGFKL